MENRSKLITKLCRSRANYILVTQRKHCKSLMEYERVASTTMCDTHHHFLNERRIGAHRRTCSHLLRFVLAVGAWDLHRKIDIEQKCIFSIENSRFSILNRYQFKFNWDSALAPVLRLQLTHGAK